MTQTCHNLYCIFKIRHTYIYTMSSSSHFCIISLESRVVTDFVSLMLAGGYKDNGFLPKENIARYVFAVVNQAKMQDINAENITNITQDVLDVVRGALVRKGVFSDTVPLSTALKQHEFQKIFTKVNTNEHAALVQLIHYEYGNIVNDNCCHSIWLTFKPTDTTVQEALDRCMKKRTKGICFTLSTRLQLTAFLKSFVQPCLESHRSPKSLLPSKKTCQKQSTT